MSHITVHEQDDISSPSPSAPSPDAQDTRDEELAPWAIANLTLKNYWATRHMFFTDKERMKAWKETSDIVKTYTDGLVEQWNKDIDTLLVYAALFSGILTAFNIQSYSLAQPTPTDPVIAALEGISAQLGGFTFTPPSINSTQPVFIYHSSTPPSPASWAVALNALWFSSLIFSLFSASIGIVVKQQLSRYDGLVGTSRHVSRLRQLRLNSFDRSHVKEIVSNSLPSLLQWTLVLFLSGLLVLLWNLPKAVAIVGTILVATLDILYLGTLILPVLVSPNHDQPRMLFIFMKISTYLLAIEQMIPIPGLPYSQMYSWTYSWIYELSLPDLFWRHRKLAEDARRHPDAAQSFYQVARGIKSLSQLEAALLSQLGEVLDGDSVATAYTVALDVHYLNHATACVTELTLNTSATCFRIIRLVGTALPSWHDMAMKSLHPCIWSAAIIALMDFEDSRRHLGVTSQSQPSSDLVLDEILSYTTAYSPRNTITPMERSGWKSDPSDIHRTRLFCVDFVRIIHYVRDSQPTAPSAGHSDNRSKTKYGFYRETFYIALLDSMQRISANDTELGNDVRHYIALTFSGYMRQDVVNDTTERSILYYTVQCIILCIPTEGSVDFKANDPRYRAVQAHVLSALEKFADFLSSMPMESLDRLDSAQLRAVSDELYLHGKRAGLVLNEGSLPPEDPTVAATQVLQDAVKDAKEAVSKWIEQLKRDTASPAGQATALLI